MVIYQSFFFLFQNDGKSKVIQKIGESLQENFQYFMFHIQIGQYTKNDQNLQQRLRLLDRIYSHVKVIDRSLYNKNFLDINIFLIFLISKH